MKRMLLPVQLPTRLDLGCGRNKINDHIGLDELYFGQEIVWDATEGIPLPDDSVLSVHSAHFFEHLEWNDVAKVLQEIVRICVDDALLTIRTPHASSHKAHYLCHKTKWDENVIKGICEDHFNLDLINTLQNGDEFFATIMIRKRKKDMEIKVFKEGLETAKINEKAGAILADATKRLTNCWVSAGTALGLYRDGDLIEGDNDIDIETIGNANTEITLTEAFPDFELVRTVKVKERIMQAAFEKDGNILDVFIYYDDGEKYVNENELGRMTMPHYIYNEIEKRETKYGALPFPKNIVDYLNLRYSEKWREKRNGKGIYDGKF